MSFQWGFKAFRNASKLERVLLGTMTGMMGVLGVSVGASVFVKYKIYQALQAREDGDEFMLHTIQQQAQHPVSGMHELFITEDEKALGYFHQFFGEYSHLLPKSEKQYKRQQARHTPVTFKPLSAFPEPSTIASLPSTDLLTVGGPSALMAAIDAREHQNSTMFLCDKDAWPIGRSSALRLEFDEDAEAPNISMTPLRFMGKQIKRVVKPEDVAQILETGRYPWRSLSWFECIKHIEQWPEMLGIAAGYQRKTMCSPEERQAELELVSKRCKDAQAYYLKLNKALGGKLLSPVRGSIIVARDEEEFNNLLTMQKKLSAFGHKLTMLTQEQMKERGFPIIGWGAAEKHHDAVLSPNYNELLSGHLVKQGGTAINGILKEVYIDGKAPGGIAVYTRPDGGVHYQKFGRLVMSLGKHPIHDLNGKPVFDLIGVTGISGLALVISPRKYKLPSVVLGDTNYMTNLSQTSNVVYHKGQVCNVNLFRFTSSACITPIKRDPEGAITYDSDAAIGLVTMIRKSYMPDCDVQILSVLPCTRAVSKFGQTTVEEIYPGVFAQYGAGGGGLTRAPEIVVSGILNQEHDDRRKMRKPS